jgi:Tetratricopeptide repeat
LYADALRLAREVKSPWDEANALDGIGLTYRSEENPTRARTYLKQALALYQSMGCTADAIRLQATLDDLAGPDSPK